MPISPGIGRRMPARTILVTGAAGFVGRHLIPALAAAFPEVRIVGTGSRGAANVVPMDVTQPDAVRELIAAEKPNICFHLAGIAAVGQARENPGSAWMVNLQGSLNLADAILAAAPGCRLVFVSSAEAYGASFAAGTPVDETVPLAPMNLYAATKAAADLALGARVGEGLRLLRLRPFNHTGPGQDENFVVPAFAAQIARIEAGLTPPELIVGALTPERDFLDIRDICDAYVSCAARHEDLANNEILNLASGHATRIGDLLERLLALSAVKVTIREDPGRLRGAEIPKAVGNAAKARKLLDWAPQIPLEETVESVLRAARQKYLFASGLQL
jgi:GDP-4-dehydro-6-deoxy-D-mannose reductase